MSSGQSPVNYKKAYDDITFQMRKQLIYLIDQEKWTIKSAAEKLGIKFCTAKQILYLFRKQGKIYRKRGGNCTPSTNVGDGIEDREPGNVVYVPYIYPLYIFCYCSTEQMPINLGHFQQI